MIGVWGLGFGVWAFGLRMTSGEVSGFGIRIPGFRVRVSGFGFRVSGFGLRVSVPEGSLNLGGALPQFATPGRQRALKVCEEQMQLDGSSLHLGVHLYRAVYFTFEIV